MDADICIFRSRDLLDYCVSSSIKLSFPLTELLYRLLRRDTVPFCSINFVWVFFLFQNEDKMTEDTILTFNLCTLPSLFLSRMGFIYFPLAQHLAKQRHRWSAPSLHCFFLILYLITAMSSKLIFCFCRETVAKCQLSHCHIILPTSLP